MRHLYLDIETGPLPEADLLRMLPPFNPDDVKLGNFKDPEKIKAKLEAAERDHKKNFIENAALSALTGEILCIGVLDSESGLLYFGNEEGEAAALQKFWAVLFDHPSTVEGLQVLGWCIHHFDMPFRQEALAGRWIYPFRSRHASRRETNRMRCSRGNLRRRGVLGLDEGESDTRRAPHL